MRKIIECIIAFILGIFIASVLLGPHAKSEPLKIYVNNAPGGSIDSIARIVTEELEGVIINQPIADGKIALDNLLKDKNSLFISSFTILQFKDIKQARPVAYIASIPFYITVSPKFNKVEYEDFLTKKNITCGSIGYKGITKIAMKRIDCIYVTYRSIIDALRDIRLGVLDSTVVSSSLAENFSLKQYKESEYLIPIGIWSSPDSDNEQYNRLINSILKDNKIQRKIQIGLDAKAFKVLNVSEFESMINDLIYSFQTQ